MMILMNITEKSIGSNAVNGVVLH